MKTLKKILCLVLTVVMVVGVLVIPANAASNDVGTKYEEALKVLDGLDILNGDESGLRPNDPITRREAAAVIARLLLTDAVASEYPTSGVSFPDCASLTWGVNYIAYCQQNGIITGDSKGFRPNDKVTGYEFAKMVLCAIGYDAATEGFVGTGWKGNVQTVARRVEINKGMAGLNWDGAISRGEVAQMVFNGLTANMVTYYTSGPSITTPDITVTPAKTIDYSGVALAEDVYGLKVNFATGTSRQGTFADTAVVTGIVTKNAANESTDKTTIGGVDYAVKTGPEYYRHYVKLYVDNSGKVIAHLDLTSSTRAVPAITDADGWKKSLDGIKVADSVVADAGVEITEGAKVSAAGTVVIVDGKIVAHITAPAYVLTKVGDIKDGKISFAGVAQPVEEKYVNAYEGMKKDDYAVYYMLGTIYNVTKAETISGKLGRISGDKLTVGGKDYNKTGTNNSGIADSARNFADTYDLYLVPDGSASNYFVAAAQTSSGPATTEVDVFVTQAYTINNGGYDAYGQPITGAEYYVQALDLDGNEVIYKISKATYDKLGAEVINNFMSVAPDTAKDCADCFVFGSATGGKSTNSAVSAASMRFANTTDYFASGVKFIYVTGSLGKLKKEVKTGVQSVKADSGIHYIATPVDVNNPTGNATVSVVVVTGDPKDVTPDAGAVQYSEVVFAWDKDAVTSLEPYTDTDGSTKAGYAHTVYIDGVETVVLTATNEALKGFYKINAKVDRLYTLEKIEEVATDNLIGGDTGIAVTNMFNGMITVGSEVVDVPVTGAVVINLSGNDKVPANAAELNTSDTVCLVVTKNANGAVTGIVTIYVVASTRA